MHDLIILAVHWVSLNVHLAADMSGILFYLLRMAVFLFPETYKSAAEVFDLKALVTFFTVTSENHFALHFYKTNTKKSRTGLHLLWVHV